MQYNCFPPEQKIAFENARNVAIEKEKQRSAQTISRIQSQIPRYDGDQGNAFIGGGFVGLIAGLFVCIPIVNADAIMGGLLVWVICGIVGGAIGVSITNQKEDAVAAVAISKHEEEYAEEQRLKKRIREIEAEYAKKNREYLENFELEAQNESVKLAESKLAKEVIDWMTDGFSRTIDVADRRSHIEQITVPFVFSVYYNKITCNLGEYNFEIKRCSNLESAVQQTALARAIAVAIQLNVVMKYPKDASGTDRTIDIRYDYSSRCVNSTICYMAPNGNYKAVEKW